MPGKGDGGNAFPGGVFTVVTGGSTAHEGDIWADGIQTKVYVDGEWRLISEDISADGLKLRVLEEIMETDEQFKETFEQALLAAILKGDEGGEDVR